MLDFLIILAILFFVFGTGNVLNAFAEIVKIIWGLLIQIVGSYWSVLTAAAFVLMAVFLGIRNRDKRMLEELKQGNHTKGGRWTDARPYQGGLAPVKNRKGLWGFVDRAGKVVYKPQFNKITFYHREKGDFWLCWGIVEGHRSGECIATSGEKIDAWDVQKELEGSCVYSEGEDVEDSSYFESSYLAESSPTTYVPHNRDEEEEEKLDMATAFLFGMEFMRRDGPQEANEYYDDYGYDEDDDDE